MFFDRYHQHFVSRNPNRDRLFADEPAAVVADGGGGTSPEFTPESSFEDIGTAAYEASTEPAPAEEGEAAQAESQSDDGTGTETPAVEGEGKSATEVMQEQLDAVNGEAMKLDPEQVPEEFREHLKNFQRDYTKKTEQLKREREKSAEELAGDELASLRAEIAALKGGPQPPQPEVPATQSQQAPDIATFARTKVEAELGKLVTPEEFFAATDNATVTRFLEQQTRLAAVTAVAEYHAQVVAPQVSTLQGTLTQQQQASVQAEYAKFQAAHPDLAPYEEQVAALYRSGMPLEDAASMVRRAVTSDESVARAMATGMQMGQQRTAEVDANKDKFSTPSSSTAAKGAPSFTPDMSFEQIAEKAAREAGVL